MTRRQDDDRARPLLPLRGALSVPGDKSISHRSVILAALARGRARISGINLGDDVRATCRILAQLGASVTLDEPNHTVEVEGCGWAGLAEPDSILDAGNSGTTLRAMVAICAAAPGAAALTGDRTLRRRPMARIVAPLRAMGASIDGRRGGELPPLWVRGGELRGVEWSSPVASAQVKTALLLPGLVAAGKTSITEPAPSRDHTERMLAAAGIALERDGLTTTVAGGQELLPLNRRVPGDVSSAMFLIVAATLIEGSDLTITDVGLNPTRTGALDVLQRMGADLTVSVLDDAGGEPVGTVTARASELSGTDVGGAEVAALIDELPILALAATQARGTTTMAGAQELRVKESDRIDALATGFRSLGADVEERPDGMIIHGPSDLRPGAIVSRGDHRVALTFAVAELVSGRRVAIDDPSCVDTSFPGWREVLAAAQGRAP
ncbi:MAG: 3-phosphoshikimate 1-carboxyvinyltransferase [Actinomycetota bacterium]